MKVESPIIAASSLIGDETRSTAQEALPSPASSRRIGTRWLPVLVSLGAVGLLLVTACDPSSTVQPTSVEIPSSATAIEVATPADRTEPKTPTIVSAVEPTVPSPNSKDGLFMTRAAYRDRLLTEINFRRKKAGTPPVILRVVLANAALDQYLADLTPAMVAKGSCFHGDDKPIPPGWGYIKSIGFGGEARGEVLGCPADNGFWTPPKIADGWWNSPPHHQSLYADGKVNAVACGVFGRQNGGRAYQTVACVTYRI